MLRARCPQRGGVTKAESSTEPTAIFSFRSARSGEAGAGALGADAKSSTEERRLPEKRPGAETQSQPFLFRYQA